MNQVVLEKHTVRCKNPIVILSLISLISAVSSCITYFVYYDSWYDEGNRYHKLAIMFPDPLSFLSLLITLAPYVLVVIYFLKFHSQLKATVLVPIIFAFIAISPIFHLIVDSFRGFLHLGIESLFELAIGISFGLATYSALKGLNKKIFLIMASAIRLLFEFLTICTIIFRDFENIKLCLKLEEYLYPVTWLMAPVGAITLCVALLLFGLNNGIPAIISASPEKGKSQNNES